MLEYRNYNGLIFNNLFILFFVFLCTTNCTYTEKQINAKIPVIIDTDANNELDDQHALAYLFFNQETFDVVGVTANATFNGGNIEHHLKEAERIMKLCNVSKSVPLKSGANGDFLSTKDSVSNHTFDGSSAVNFIIEESRKDRNQPLVLLPVGKLTNIALALIKAPDIADKIRIVWLGSNYPEKGEYNQVNDLSALNFILDQDVPFEMVMVRYGKPSGTDAVRVTPEIMQERMKGIGPIVPPIEGRNGGSFTNFGDYSIDLFSHIDLYGNPPSRALFDMVAVAILKNENWGRRTLIPAPILVDSLWQERADNARKITIWEDFEKDAILEDFFNTMNTAN